MDLQTGVARALAPLCGLDEGEIAGMLETPKDPKLGDAALPCFRLAKQLRKAPNAIAAELMSRLVLPAGVGRAEAVRSMTRRRVNSSIIWM